MDIDFLDAAHKKNFEILMGVNEVDLVDRERVALFYILSSIHKFRSSPSHYYNFDSRAINRGSLNGKLSSGEYSLLQLAYHLFTWSNDFEATPMNIFSNLDNKFSSIALNAIKLRFKI